jgi:hydroxymethylpyrimidine pyrophosphatase-like HAD family hydrolase
MSKKILFTDLDDTLFQSKRKCPDHDELLPVAYLKDGTAHSFQTQAQANLLQAFMDDMIVVPVTARNMDAFNRVKIDFKHGAIVNFGGTILNPDGQLNETWLATISVRCKQFRPVLNATAEWAHSKVDLLGGGLRARVIEDHGCPFYVSIKSTEGQEPVLDDMEFMLREQLQTTDLSVHRNGNNLVAMPNWLDKRHAVEFMKTQFKTHYGPITTIGMGDSLSDLGFMKQCDYMIAPSGSQIMQCMEVE